MRRKRGFTLVEIIISMLLLCIVVAGMMVVFIVGRRSVRLAGHKVQAMNFARDAIEDLKGRVGGDLWTPTDYYLDDTGGVQIDYPRDIPPGDFRDTLLDGDRYYLVENIDADLNYDSDGDGDPTNDTDYKRVTVTVDWDEP